MEPEWVLEAILEGSRSCSGGLSPLGGLLEFCFVALLSTLLYALEKASKYLQNDPQMAPQSVSEATGRGQESAQAAFRLLEGSWSSLGAILGRKKVVREGPGRLLRRSRAIFQPN